MTNIVVSPSTTEKEVLTGTTVVEYIVDVNPSVQQEVIEVTVIDDSVNVVVESTPIVNTVDVVIQNSNQVVLIETVDATKTVNVVINEETSGSATEDPDLLANKTFVYNSGVLTRLQFSTGNYKDFFYDLQGRLDHVDYIKTNSGSRKTINYGVDGSISSVITTII